MNNLSRRFLFTVTHSICFIFFICFISPTSLSSSFALSSSLFVPLSVPGTRRFMVLCSSDNSQKVFHSNLLNAVADVSSDGKYVSAIKDPDQKFGAFMSPLTSGRVTIASSAIYSAKVGLAIVIRYSLSRRAFSVTANGPEVLLLDYPSHRRRLLPLLAKPYAMSFAANELKMIYVKNLRPTKRSMLLQVGSKQFTLGTIYEHFRNVVKLLEGKWPRKIR